MIKINSTLKGTGWLPPLPDLRDFTEETQRVYQAGLKLGVSRNDNHSRPDVILPTSMDLRKNCSPIEDQGQLGSCTAQAAVGIVEYFQQKAYGKHINMSRLYLYKTTRNLMRVKGDTGAYLRSTMGALALCGVPPEDRWPYTDNQWEFDKEPGAFEYAVADNYEALYYFCHAPVLAPKTGAETLMSVKRWLAVGIPAMFGFVVYDSISDVGEDGVIPYPGISDSPVGGHAIVAAGYDDDKKALLIRNSWGTGWGDDGYGWLPYEYVENKLAYDFWSLLSMGWVDTGRFGL